MKKLITVTFCSLFAMSAFADGDEKSKEAQTAKLSAFTSIDADSDGYITEVESKSLTGLSGQFQKLDTDGDKRLSRAEFLRFEMNKR